MATNKTQKMASIRGKQDIEIELSTRPALRLWTGRQKTPKRHGIIGLPGFCSIARSMEVAIRADDPYADYHYHCIEKAIEELSFDLDSELKDIQSIIDENVPSTMRVPDVSSKNPAVLPVRFASRLGFRLLYQVLKTDEIVLKVLLANHIGILPNTEKFDTLSRVEKRVRSVTHMVFAYKHTEVTRDDIASNNQKAQQAIKTMGVLEQEYLDGSVRSENAPQLPLKRLQTLSNVIKEEKVNSKSKSKPKSKDKEESGKDEGLGKEALEAELDSILEASEKEMSIVQTA